MPGAAVEMNSASHFRNAAKHLRPAELSPCTAWTLGDLLATCAPSSLAIFRCISELTRAEALEVLACLSLRGREGIPAAIRISAVLRSSSAAWEILSEVIELDWSTRDLALLAINFGTCARFSRDWSACVKNAVEGNEEAKVAMAALLETSEINFQKDCLQIEGPRVTNWDSQGGYENEPSLGRELAWCFFAAQCQMAVEASMNCVCTAALRRDYSTVEQDWLQPAEPGNEILNKLYFRMFGVLMKKRSKKLDEAEPMRTSSQTDFAFTRSVREVFYQFACLSSSCNPIILEGPYGCGKSALLSRLAHITSTGFNSPIVSDDNVCFVHMDTAANKEDSNDFLSLVGCVVPLPDGGGFRWRLGPIGHAILNGQWLVLESMDCDSRVGNACTSALVSKLASVRPGDEFQVPSRSEPLRVGLGFRLIATRTVKASESEGNKRWAPPGGWEAWQRVSLPTLSEEEQASMLNLRFPSVADCVSRVLRAISGVRAKILRRCRTLDREPSLREAVRICQRLVHARNDTPHEFSPELALLETLDTLVLWASDEELRKDLIAICSEAWSLPVQVGRVLMSERSPPVLDLGDAVQIGRSRSLKSSKQRVVSGSRKLAMTKHTARVLERIARCISVGESVLLNGETGTGKTATLQELARLSNKELVVVNMSQQSDIGDLLGGFRPFEMAAVLPALVKRFDEAFCKHLSIKKNARFLDALHKAARSQKQCGRALRLMRGAIQAIRASVRTSDSDAALEWTRISRMVAKLEKLMPGMDVSSASCTKLQVEQREANPPPRKRQRSNPKIGKDAMLVERMPGSAVTGSPGEGKKKRRQISFEYSDGVLVSALRAGHWVLLDEINLAPMEVLDHLVSLLDHRSLTILNEEGETIHAAEGFALFAAMNPPTDFGKRPLAKEIRSRVTEFFIEDIENKDDIAVLVSHRLFGVDVSEKHARRLSTIEARLAQDIAEFYLAVRALAKNGTIDDASGKCARFSLRTLSIMLSHAANLCKHMTSNTQGERRAAFEGALLAFSTPLPRSARGFVDKLALQHLMHQTHRSKKGQPDLFKEMQLPKGSSSCTVAGFPIETLKAPKIHESTSNNFVVTAAVNETLVDVCRALTYGVTRVPILLQGPTSAGKTSLVSYLASLTGNTLIRINNHEHTDLAEYLGCYIADDRGSLVFREGPLVRAVREGLWVVLDELNLAPPEVLESLNRLLDDNKEIRIPETGEVVKAHKNFTLFATQNPPGVYGGRKELSRAFRGRFIEIQVDELPDADLIEIIERRCRLPTSFAKKMVAVMRELQTRRRVSRLFSGKSGFVTARDLFRWGARRPLSREDLAVHGFFLLGERARNVAERDIVREVLVAKIGVDASVLNDSTLYRRLLNPSYPIEVNLPGCDGADSNTIKNLLSRIMYELQIANTPHMARMITLLLHCASNNEPALLVGPTGSGKTSACSLLAAIMKAELLSVNCHRHTESSDLVGGFRPGRRSEENAPLFEWTDGPLVQAMKSGHAFLMDEINMADDAVVERLNAVLEPSRTLMLSEKGSDSNTVVGHANFRIFATMNPGGDFGKKELSPALRNRFTEIWIPSASALEDFFPVVQSRIIMNQDDVTNAQLRRAQEALRSFLTWMSRSQQSGATFSNSNFIQKKQSLSLRDVTTWSNFIHQATTKCGLHAMVAFAHGARLVFLDGMSVGANAIAGKELETELWSKVLAEVPVDLREMAKKASLESELTNITSDRNGLHFGPFLLKSSEERKSGQHSQHTFCMAAPCTLRNSGRVVRALAVDSRPILLEGPPGAGKTSLVGALARAAHMQLSRINLSESTEMSDLIGGDIPGPVSGQFCFRKGELLRAVEGGFWVLLDEMNLASQSVLEGLNSLLDHRRSVFIPELASEIVAHPDFRIFAAQNPAREGCGRRGLPQSFLNRFTKVAVEAPSDDDLVLIATATHPRLEKHAIADVVRTLSLLKVHFESVSGGESTAEFGLRQVLRWCRLLDVYDNEDGLEDDVRTQPDAELCFDVIVSQGLANSAEREAATSIFRSVFNHSKTMWPQTPSVRIVNNSHVRVGWAVIRKGSYLNMSSLGGFCQNLRSSRTRCLQAMAIVVNAGWPCIVSGELGYVSVSETVGTVESFAALSGQKLLKLKGGSFLDADDLLGGYTQKGIQGELCKLRLSILSLYNKMLSSILTSQPLPNMVRRSLHDFEASIAQLASAETGFEPNEHGQLLTKSFVNVLSESVTLLTALADDDSTCNQLWALAEEIELISSRVLKSVQKAPPTFCWERSQLVHAIERGDWVVIEDADQCSPSVLDRLNPLLELSARAPSYKNLDEKHPTHEPVLLPEAPPNPDGSPAVICPHPNFRLFLVVDDSNGQRISRAIVDRSIKLKLVKETSASDKLHDILSGSKPNPLTCVTCKSKTGDESLAPVTDESLDSSLQIQETNWHQVPELRAVLSTVCTGMADFCLQYEHSLRMRDMHLLYLMVQAESSSHDLKDLEDILVSSSCSITDAISRFGSRPKEGEQKVNSQSNFPVSFKAYLLESLSQMFLLGCTSSADFSERRQLLSSMFRNRSTASIDFVTPTGVQDVQNRTDFCLDPVYGFDSVCPSRQEHFRVTKGQFAQAICLRFDIIVISHFLQSWKDIDSNNESFSYGGDDTPFFGISKRQSNVSGQELQPKDAVSFLGSVVYKVLLRLVYTAQNFRSEVIPNDLDGWTFPEEPTWLQLFKFAQKLLDFSRMPCNSTDRTAYGMVLLRQIHNAVSVLGSDIKNPNLRLKLHDLAQLCGQRAKYEFVRPALPIPRTESGLRLERDLMILASQESSRELGIARLSVPKALVNLSTPVSENDEQVSLSILSLKCALQDGATNRDLPGPIPEERIEFPLWKQIMWTSLADICLTLLILLQESEVQLGVDGLSALRSCAEQSLLEFSINPVAPLQALVPVQRIAWILSSGIPHATQISELINEGSLSSFMVTNRKYEELSYNRSPEYLFCQSVASDTLANSLLSFHLIEDPAAMSITSHAAVAAACTLVSGQSFTGEGLSSQRLLRLRYLANSLYSLGLLYSGVGRKESLPKDERNVLPSLILAQSICEEVASSPVLSMLKNYGQVQSGLRNASGLIEDTVAVRTTPHALLALVSGFLWVVNGVIRVQKAFSDIECLHGIDPSSFAEAEFDFLTSQCEESASLELACNASSVLKLGGDDLEASVPKLRAVRRRKTMSEQAIDRKSEIIHRPKDFTSFSVFLNAVARVRALLSEQSLIWKLFDISLQGSFMSGTLNFVQQQLRENVLVLLEKSCASLEIGGELSHFRDVGGTVARGLREVQHGALLSLKGLSVAISEASQEQTMNMKSLEDLLQFPRAAFSDGSDSLEIVNRLKVNRLRCDVQAKAIRFLFLHGNGYKAYVLPAVRKCFSALVADWKTAQLKEESEEAVRNSLFVIRENARVEDMPGMSELHSLENEEEEDFDLHFNVNIAEVDELVVGIGRSETGEEKPISDPAKSSETVKGSVLDVSDFWNHHASCFLHSWEDGVVHQTKEKSFVHLLSALGGIANETKLSESDSGISVAALASCILSSRVSGGEQLYLNEQSNRRTYNFYKDSNTAEVSKMKTALRHLIARIADVQRQFIDSDGKHPVLNVVTDAAERALRASDITVSLGPLVSVLETVLRKADEWQRIFATKALSLEDETKQLSKLALRWRRIEVESWPNLLSSREELAKQRAEKWFYYLYDGLIGDDDNPYDGEENLSSAVSTMDQFLRSSPLGEYETRIQMLLSISAQLESSDLASHRKFGHTVSGLCLFYKQFLPSVQTAISNAKDPLEKKMSDFARLSTWHGEEALGGSTKMTKGADKELEYFRLKARSEKVRRKLHKLCRDADSVLRVPVFNEISKEIQRNGFAEMGLEASGNLAPMMQGNRNTKQSSCASSTIAVLLNDEFKLVSADCPIRVDTLALFEPSSRLSKLSTLCKRMKDIGAVTVESDCFSLKQAEMSSTLLQNAIRSRAIDLRQSCDAGIQVKKRALVELLRALEIVGVSPFEKPSMKLRSEPSFWLGVKSPFRIHGISEKADSLFFKVASRIQRLRAVSDGRVRNADITPDESKKSLSFCSDLFDRAILQRENLIVAVSALNDTKEIVSQMANFHSAADNGVSPSLTLVKSLFDVVNRVDSIQKDVFFALRYAEQELKKAEAISQENVRNLASNKYPVLSIKRCLSAAKASVLVLEKAHSLLLSFMSVKPVVTLLRLSRTTVYLVTQELADSCKASLKHLGVLSESLQHQLRTAERTSKLSLASSTLRSIVSYVRESIRVCDLELQACSKSDDSAQSEKTAIVTAPILQKCESAIESTLRFAQTIMAKSESVGNENESMHKAEPLNSDKENILQPNILRKGHNMATGASNRTGVLKLKSALVEILEQVNKADRIRNSHDEEIDNGASFSRLEVAVRNLGYFITCYINAFAIPYMRSASSFHMESLGLLKTMTSIFIGIAEEGFCRPPEQEENAEDDTLPSNVDGTGFGDIGEGDASLAKDVSEEVEDEEQLLGMRNENNASNDKNQDQNDVDGDTGVEMTCDFEGELQDVERPEPDNENDKDPDDEEQEKMDEQFGEEPDEKAVDIDERLWNDEDEANDGGKDQKDRDQGEIESGKREQNVTLAARENSENHRPQPESEKQSEKNSRDNDRNADSMEGEEESDGEQQDGEGETGDGAREDDNEDKEEQPKRKQPKMGDNDDAISGEEPEEVQEEDMQMSPLDDEAADGKDASNPRGSDDEGSDMDREEPMVGTNVDGPGQDGESPEPHEEKEGDGLDAPINEDVMNNLEGAPLGDDEDMADAQNPDEPNDGLPLESDKCMDELPPEQSAMDEDPLSESHDDEARLDANDEPPSQNVPEQKNLSNSNPVSGGTKTTPSARHEEDITDNTLLFSNPDPSGASGARNEASANAEEVGSTGEGKETGETSTSNSQLETASRGSNPLPKLEDFESLSVQHDPNPFRALQEGQLGNEWEKRMNVLKDFVKSGDASKDDVGVKHDVPGNEAALHEFVSESENKNDNDKSALGPATEDQHKPLQKASEEPEEDHMDVNPVDGSETGDEPRRNSDVNQNRNTSEVPKTSEKADDEVMKPAEEDVVVSDVTTAQAVIEHPLVSAMRQLEDLNIEKSESKEEDNDPRIPNEPESLSKEHEDNDQEMLDADIKGSVPDVTAEASFEETDFCAMWRKLERLTEADAAALCEQLRLVLEPTVRSGLAGSFKTGKRLDMKKVIDFVASDFRRDRIWLRRVRPSKRSYDVLVAIDDSLSMSESGAGALALAGLVLLHSALSKLEVGRVGILRFGADCHIVRDLNESIPIDEDKGGDILSQFSFSEKSTNLQQLLVSSQDLLRQSRGSSSEDDVQLLFIISDGKLDKREELRKQLRLMASENILVAFIVVNSNATEKTNIFSVKQVTYGDDGRMKVTSYMSDFPFQFYTVIHDVKLLPNVLGNALRQWLELMANLS